MNPKHENTFNNTKTPLRVGGEGTMIKKRKRRQRPITAVNVKRSHEEWLHLIEEAKSKESSWKFLKDADTDAYYSSDSIGN